MPGAPVKAARRKAVRPNATARAAKKRKAHRKLYAELNTLALEAAVERPTRGLFAGDVLQIILERLFGHWAYASQMVNQLGPEAIWYQDSWGAWHLNKWYNLERSLSKDLERVCTVMEQLGLTARFAAVEEEKALMVGKYMASVLEKLELTPAQRKALRPAMDEALPLLEGTATEALAA